MPASAFAAYAQDPPAPVVATVATTPPAPERFGDGRRLGKRAKVPEVRVDRLVSAMRVSRRTLRVFRTERVNAIRNFVGFHWSEGGSDWKIPVNLIGKFVQVMSRTLCPHTPRVMCSTMRRKAQPAVSVMQDAMNDRLKAMHFEEKVRRWVVDGLFSIGVMKVAIATPEDAGMMNYQAKAGEPFCEVVDLDDFLFDPGCRDLRSASWVAHRYSVPLELAESLDYFDPKLRKELKSRVRSGGTRLNEGGDERIDWVTRGGEPWEDGDYYEMVDLWEVYLPRTRQVVTLAADTDLPSETDRPLRVQPWVGPDCGPFHYLLYNTVPGSAMPKGPVLDLIDLHESVNHLYRKLIMQAAREKEVLPVSGGKVDDGKQLVQASDGEMFTCDSPDLIKSVRYGGPSAANTSFSIHLQDLFNKQAGNLDLLSGAAPQSKTATQDKILAENASSSVTDLQETTVSGIASVCEALGWYLWYHPEQVMESLATVAGVPDVSLERKLYPAGASDDFGRPRSMTREGRYEDVRVRVDPYSLVHRTPQQRLAFLSAIMRDTLPLLAIPQVASQGVTVDVQAYLKIVSEYGDEPAIADVFTTGEPVPQDVPSATSGPPSMAPNTSREYVRRSVGQDTPANNQADMENAARMQSAEQGGT